MKNPAGNKSYNLENQTVIGSILKTRNLVFSIGIWLPLWWLTQALPAPEKIEVPVPQMMVQPLPVVYNCPSCPAMLGILINACNVVGTDEASNEFLIMHSGCGFSASNLSITTLAGTVSTWVTPNATLLGFVQECSNVIAATSATTIPAGALVMVFTDNGTPTMTADYDMTYLCSLGVPIYILQSNTNVASGFFNNNTGFVTYTTSGSCSSTYNWSGYSNGTSSQILFAYSGMSSGLLNSCTAVPFNLMTTYDCNPVITPALPFSVCSGDGTITLTANPSSGTWSGPGVNASGVFDPGAANIGLNEIIFDASCGGSDTIDITVLDGPIIDPSLNLPDGAFSSNSVPCEGGTTTLLFFESTISGGTGSYTLDWDYLEDPGNENFPEDGQFYINGPAGWYAIIVTDANGCIAIDSAEIENALPFNVLMDITPPVCYGAFGTIEIINNGTEGMTMPPGIGPPGIYVFDWDLVGTPGNDDFGPGATNWGLPPAEDDPNDLFFIAPAGTYNLTVTVYGDDVSSPTYVCVFDTSIVMTQPVEFMADATNATILCFGGMASVTVNTTNGTGPFVYDWQHLGGPNNGIPVSVTAGSYPVTVTDANGCTDSDIAVVTQPAAALSASATGAVVTCNNGSGNINLTVSGGTPNYTFIWSNTATTEDLTGLFAGTYTVTVTDINGCTATASAAVTVQNTSPPVINCPPPLTLPGCNGTVPAANFAGGAASDDCSPPTVTHVSDVTASAGCIETTTRTYMATDASGNTTTCTQIITRTVDTTIPTITCPVNVTLSGCNPVVPAPNVGSVGTSDGCGASTVTHVSDAIATVGCIETTTRTYMATDVCGNTATCTHTITRTVDTAPPTLSGQGSNMTLNCPVGAPSFTAPTATDPCDATPTIMFTDVTTPGSCPGNYSVTRTWTATDDCGNVSPPVSQTITVQDITPPTLSGQGANATVACPVGAPSFTAPTATDACDPTPTITSADVTTPGACPGNYSVTRTWTATDDCGNAANVSQTITVQDIIAPVLSGQGPNSTVNCPAGAPSFTAPTATDACDATPTISSSDATTPGSCPGNYSVTRTWTATDDCGNVSAPVSQTITVQDITPPTLSGQGANTTANCPVGAPAFTAPTATDACDPSPAITFSDVTTPGSCPGNYSVTRTWIATDDCGNVSPPVSQTITVQDITPPTLSGQGANATVNCPVGAPSFTAPTATDACDPSPTITFSDVTTPGSCPGNYTVTRTWIATDDCGNVSPPVSQTITVQDITPPTLSGQGSNATVNCPVAAPTFTAPTASDTCDPTPTISFTDATTPGPCPGTYSTTRTWIATDDCGNVSAPVSQTITVQDITPPTLSGQGSNATVNCPVAAPAFTAPTATDACDATPTISFTDATTPGPCPGTYSTTRTWIATDDCGNVSAPVSQTITVQDITPPTISGQGSNATVNCPVAAPTFTAPTASDTCDPTPTISFTDATTPGPCPGTYSTTRTWIATDDCGNVSAPVSQTITVQDITPPTLSGQGSNATVNCPVAAPTFTAPTATDACDPTPNITFTDATTPGSCPGNYSVTRTWIATDDCGNVSAPVSQTITVQDITPPTLSGQGSNATVNCPVGAPSFTAPTATDACDPTPTITFTDVTTPGSCPGNYTVTRTWIATDDCGNVSAPVSQTITVQDITPPVLNGQGSNATVNCPVATPTFTAPTATDACDATPTITFTDATTPGPCPGTYSTTRTWIATDDCGNVSAPVSQTITVQDITPPTLSGQGSNATVNCPVAAPTFTAPTATDACDATPTISFTDATTPGPCPGTYSTTRTWIATDDCGNASAPVTQTITVQDITPPTLSGQGSNATVNCPVAAPTFTAPTATDACDPAPTITFTDATTPGPCPGTFSTTRTWIATDDCGNASAPVTQTITVQDITPPTLSGQGPNTTADCPVGVPPFTAPTATDACDPTPTITFTDATTPGSCPGNYTVTRTWIATDDCGNASAPVTQTITVQDVTPPTLSGQGSNATVNCPAGAPSFTAPTATDACDPTPTITFTDVTTPGSCPGNYTVTRTWIATDDCGNVSPPVSQTITVQDITSPVLSGQGSNTTVNCPVAAPSFTAPTATDACDPTPTITFTDVTTPGSCPGNYTVTRTWIATDDCGNVSAPVSQTITVQDITPPTLSGQGPNAVVNCPVAAPSFTAPTATDACDPTPTITFTDATTPGPCPGTYSMTRTWIATDDCGNVSAPVSQTIAVQDITPPTLSGQGPNSTVDCPVGAPAFTAPTATDACDPDPTITFTDATTPGPCPGTFSTTRTWIATDDCGNASAPVTQTITVQDITPPTLSGQGPNSTVNCPAGAPAFIAPTATDACDLTPTITFTDVTTPGSCPGNYSITRTWIATDDCGNASAPVSQTITVQDITPPTLSGQGPNTTVNCPAGAPSFTAPTATDACDPTPTITFTDVTTPGSCPGNYTVTRTWIATDDCGNTSAPVSQIITVQDITPPTLSGQGPNTTVNCPAGAPSFTAPTATDACDPTPTITFSDVTTPGSCPGNYTVTRTWIATDDCGNVSPPVSQTFTVQDITPPVLSGQGPNATVNCPVGAPSFIAPTATDACDPSPIITFNDATTPGPCPGTYSTTRTWIAEDECGNVSAPVSQTITVQDITPPTLSGQGPNATVDCPVGTPSFTAPTASDVCDPSPTITFTDATTPGPCPGAYSTTRTWIATDDCGNASAPVSQTITVQDITPPTLSGQGPNSTVNCPAGAPSFTAPTATDACDPTPTITFSDVTTPGSCPGNYSITRTWVATDDCGNVSAPVSQTITVQDITPPVLSGQGPNSTIDCPVGAPSFTAPTATDACDPTPTITFTDATTPGPCPGTYSITRTWIATDDCGNVSAPVSQTITVQDITPPVLSGQGLNSTVNCPVAAPTFTAPTATDACDPTPTITFTDVTTPGSCPGNYSVTRTWIATDDCGNVSAPVSQTITVQDITPPVLSGQGPNATVNCPVGAPTFTAPTATDACDPTPTITFTDATTPGPCPGTNSTTRTWIAIDDCGNVSAPVSQTITVQDITPPVLSGQGPNSTVNCPVGAPSFTAPTATDACDPSPIITFTDVTTPGSCPGNYTITRTWIAEDACGNISAPVSQTITVQDITPPVLSGQGPNSTLDCPAGAPSFTAPTATDACDPTPTITFSDVTTPGSCPGNYSITRTWVATDDCGNVSAPVSQTISVQDITPPVLSGQGPNATVDCPIGAPTFTAPTATDACDPTPTITFTDATTPGSCPGTYSTTRTWIATDDCGNASAPVSQTITVQDITPPVLSGQGPNATVNCPVAVPTFTAPTATDACDPTPTITFTDVTTPGSCPGNYSVTRTWLATDDCGNVSAPVSQTITVEDITPPVLSGQGPNATVDCPVGAPSFTAPTATDACDATPTITFTDVTTPGPCPGTYSTTRTWIATDDCGNVSAPLSQTITVQDITPPTLSGQGPNATVDCPVGAPSFTAPTATDACDPTPTITFTDATTPGPCPGTYSTTRTWIATDDCGNVSAPVSQTIIVQDITPPTASNPAPTSVQCIGDVPVPDPLVVIDEADNCSTPVVAFVNETVSGPLCPQTITRIYSVTDACGNSITVTHVITVNDDIPPTASNPAPITVQCIGNVPAADPLVVIDEADNCSSPVVTLFSESTTGTCPQTITRIYTVTDACGNTTNVTHIITVDDDIAPTASNPAPITVQCISNVPVPDPSLVIDEADNCSTPVVAFVNETTTGTCPQTITRIYSVTDLCGNSINVTHIITVNDDIAPTASNPAPVSVQCIGDVPAPDPSVVTDEADNCSAPLVAFVSETLTGTCPQTITRIYSVTDLCNNSINVTQVITIDDNTLPTATNPAPVTVDCIGDVPAPDVNVVSDEADNCTGFITVAFVSDVPDGASCPMIITRTYSVTDACGNILLVTQAINIDDDVPPTASNPAPVNVECNGDIPSPDVNVITDEADNCTGPLVVAFVDDVDNGASCPQIITRTYSITDECGNSTLVTQTINVNDDTPPTASNPAPINLPGCNPTIPAPDVNVVTDEADNCGAPIVAFVGDVPTLAGCTETTTRTFSVTDSCGNSILVTQVITRTYDPTPPSILGAPGNITVDCISDVPPIPDLTYTDNCSPGGTIIGVETGPSGNPLTIIRTWTITDDCGNTTTATQIITILESLIPIAVSADFCTGESVDVYGVTYNIPGIYLDTISSTTGGCDTLATITITELPLNNLIITSDICPGETVTINGVIYSTPGSYQDTTLSTTGGCDTVLMITINGLPLINNTITADICPDESVTIYGEIYDTPGTYQDTIPSITGGCDTAVTITIIGLPLINHTVSADICPGESVIIYGEIYNAGGTYQDTITSTMGGCDTAVVITINQLPLINNPIAAGICPGETITLYGVTYSAGGTYQDTITSTTGGCDTAVVITINELPYINNSVTANICPNESVTIYGTTYSSAGSFQDTVSSTTGGCDTIVMITINQLPYVNIAESANLCPNETVTFYGVTYTVGGTYQDTVASTTSACDTAVIITITESLLNNNTLDIDLCIDESVTIYGIVYNAPGTYLDTVANTMGGCDTAVVINITELPLLTNTLSVDLCENQSITIYGEVYNAAGTYLDTVPSITSGCDTAVTIEIAVFPFIPITIDESICEGSSVVVYGVTYSVAGTFQDTVMSATGGCDTSVTINITEIPFSQADLLDEGPLCTVFGTVTLSATPAGGVWSGSVSSDQFDPLALGTGIHQVIYTVNPGVCESADTIQITVYELIVSCQSIQDETLPGTNDGEGQVTVSGGYPPYNINWTGPVSGSIVLSADGTFVITGLTAGVYTVEVEDNSNCLTTCQFTIVSGVPCEVVIDDISIQDATCPGANNGAISITASGGLQPYQYSINGITYQISNVFANLAPGTYTVYVRDNTPCIETQDVTIGVGTGPTIIVDDVENASCGVSNGSITVSGTGGSIPYTYSINGVTFFPTGVFTGLAAGNYNVIIQDNALCSDTILVPVLANGAPIITDINIDPSSCGQADGSITIIATGGTGQLLYSIGGPFQTSNVFAGLPAGIYPVTVRDEALCDATGTATIQDAGGPVIDNIIVVPANCGASDGSITITATGNPPLSYSINCVTYGASNIFNSLPAGTYTVCVRDVNGCITSEPVTLNTIDGPQIDDVDVTHTTCGESNGTILITASGGVGDLEYFLNGISYDDENFIEDLPDGVYDIEVIDENDCPATWQVTINPSVGPDFQVYVTPDHCGMGIGCIELDGFGTSIPPYTYSINGASGPFVANPVFCNLLSDFYDMAIKDGAGCIYEEEVFVWDIPGPEIDSVVVTAPECGMTNGIIEIFASSPYDLEYSIAIPFFQSSPLFSPVPPGTYTITVRDEYGCIATSTAIVPATPAPNINNIVVVNSQCGQSTGSLTVNASGGVPILMYQLNTGPFVSSNVFSGLSAGTYTVTVRGANGCTDSEVRTITSIGQQNSTIADAICNGDTLVIAGDTFTIPGTYSITLVGGAANGCDSVIALNLSGLPFETFTIQASICAGEVYTINGIDYGAAGLYLIDTVPSGIGCDTIRSLNLSIDPLETFTIQASICVGDVYTINGVDYNVAGLYLIDTVSAGSGCDTIRSLNLSIDPLETTFLDVTICNNGVFTINGVDYTVAGQYLIDTIPASIGCDSIRTLRLQVEDFQSDSIEAEICAGDIYTLNGVDYSVAGFYVIDTVPGPGGCDTIITLEIIVDPLPTAGAGADQVLDCEILSVVLNGSATGGNPSWTGPGINAGNQNLLMPTVSLPGEYIITVTSPAGCTDQDTVWVISDPSTVIANAGIDDSLSCIVMSIVLQANPTGSQYTYQWTGPGINASNEHLVNPIITVAGTYSLVVTDTSTNCVSAPDLVDISDNTPSIIAIIQNPNTLDCFSTFIDLNATGSSTGPNIIYLWFNENNEVISTSPLVTGITTGGIYSFTVKDTISGCFDNDTVVVEDLLAYPPVDAGLPQEIDCNNETVWLNQGAVNNLPNIIFQWTGPAGGTLSPNDSISVLVGLGGEYHLEAMDTVTGCTNSDSVMVNDMTALPLADIGLLEAFTCLDSIAMLDIGSSDTGPDILYEWNGPLINGVNTLILEPTQPGQYNLTVTNQSTGCESIASITLSLPVLPDGLDADIDIPLCAGDTSGSLLITNVSGGQPVYMYSIDGDPLTTDPLFESLIAGNYTVQVVDANGCSYEETFTIPDGQVLTIDIGPDIELELGDSSILYANVSFPWSQIDSIVWSLGDNLSCTHCINPTLYGLIDEIITATVYSGSCIASDNLQLLVDVDADVYIPNIFSPNDDGVNDIVTVFADPRVERVVYFEIFDRWGNQVFVGTDFDANDLQHGWDGTFKDKLMNPAVFAYIAQVELINGDLLNFKGDITLIR